MTVMSSGVGAVKVNAVCPPPPAVNGIEHERAVAGRAGSTGAAVGAEVGVATVVGPSEYKKVVELAIALSVEQEGEAERWRSGKARADARDEEAAEAADSVTRSTRQIADDEKKAKVAELHARELKELADELHGEIDTFSLEVHKYTELTRESGQVETDEGAGGVLLDAFKAALAEFNVSVQRYWCGVMVGPDCQKFRENFSAIMLRITDAMRANNFQAADIMVCTDTHARTRVCIRTYTYTHSPPGIRDHVHGGEHTPGDPLPPHPAPGSPRRQRASRGRALR